MGKFAEGLESLRPAAAIQNRLADDEPGIAEYQSGLATTHLNIGVAQAELGRPEEAMESYRRALAAQEVLALAHPSVGMYLSDLAIIHNNIGNLQRDAGRQAEALDSHGRALAIRERLVRDHPSNHYYRSNLGVSLHTLAQSEMDQGRWQEAQERLNRAIECQRAALAVMPKHPFYQQVFKLHLFNLVKVHQALNHPADALRAARELAALPRENSSDLYNVACALALPVPLVHGEQQEALAAEAVQALKQAIAAGWNDAGKTSRDPDLASLRDRDDFRRLMADLFDRSFPANPFAP
jgi:eukaryotic-like serine/threonine-protein kinase